MAKRFDTWAANGTAWRTLFEVFGVDKEDPARQRIRVVGIESKSMGPPVGLPREAHVSCLTGEVVGSTTVQTTLMLDRNEVVVAGSEDSIVDAKLDALYASSWRAASAVLYETTKRKFDVVEEMTTTLDDLANELPPVSLRAAVVYL